MSEDGQLTEQKNSVLLNEIPLSSVKIKQEKITPPTSPVRNPATQLLSVKQEKEAVASNEHTIGESVFATFLPPSDDKKAVALTKSSEELLAELFQSFNSVPPTTLLADDGKTSKKSKKKHKKDKKKKHKKKGRSSSDEENGEDGDKAEKKLKLKKVKKEKKDKSLDEKDIKSEKEKSKKRKSDDPLATSKHKKKKKDKDEERKDELDIDEYEKQLLEKVHREESTKSDPKMKSKIFIKSFKHSAIFEENVKQAEQRKKEKEKERKRDKHNVESESDQSKSSEISLSDEETYERNRSRFYERDTYYGNRSRDDRHRDRSPRNRSRDRYESRESSYYGHGYRGLGSRYDDRDRDRRRRRSRSRSLHSADRIDKKRLLEIARKNAISMLKNGTLPGTQNLAPEAKEKVLAKMRFGGKSVDELTEFCKKLSNGESSGYLSDVSDDSDHDEDGNDRPFNHPFMLKERNEPIVMNIKNATPIPPKTAEQTKAILMQFPVSSGQHHRLNESEWVPVPPAPKKPAVKAPAKVEKTVKQAPAAIMPAPPNPEPVPAPETNIFPDANVGSNLDVTTIITKRLNAMRKLQDNPLDQEAIKLMYNTQKDMSAWANSKFVPGQFTGSTGANILSARELTSGFQAWAKRDQLITATPLSSGMGMHLLQKMGWRPGEGLGKEKNGSLQPLLLEVKLDKKGLVANDDNSGANNQPKRRKPMNVAQATQNMESKHPVSLLGELSAKRKWQMPKYDLVCEDGPHHNRQFLFTVEMNGMVYRPPTASNNKKEAKAVAAKFALQQMGVLP
ncbi:hypothetical protein HA402_004877 [Bradysia odoriphaga]|nr:hypothetical protein HA402_004877 [Bradysia odoriphaga]